MKFSVFDLLLLSAVANAHAIFQRISVNGADKGYLTGMRAPNSNNPLKDVTSPDIVCNTGLHSPASSAVVSVAPGDKVGALWQHVLGGAAGANDAENPIASSHKGPIMYYLAKVPNAATTSTTGLKWFKVAQDTLTTSNGQWGVDRMIANKGWSYFTMPSCVAPGNYLLRAEIIALHQAQSAGGAQFYLSCGQIQVTGSGTAKPATVSFPGAYKATDPGIQINIYGSSGQPNNNGKPYPAPGPAVLSCGAGGKGKQPTPSQPQKPPAGGGSSGSSSGTSPGGSSPGGSSSGGSSPGGSNSGAGGSAGGSNGGAGSAGGSNSGAGGSAGGSNGGDSSTCTTSTSITPTYPMATPPSMGGGGGFGGGGATSSPGSGGAYPTPVSQQANSGKVALYGQCAGQKWTGPTVCAIGTCRYQNPYYSQCLQ